MTDLISRKEFQEANAYVVSSITNHINEKFEAHSKLESLRHERIDTALAEYGNTLYGDPKSNTAVGLRIKVDRLNTWAKAVSAAFAAVFTAGMSYLGFK